MDRFDRIFLLHKELVRARVPVSCARLEEALECARATVIRTIADMRDHLGAPIVYDRPRNGYLYATGEGGGRYELPGLWFNAEETFALLACHQLLRSLQPGLLDSEIDPLRQRLEQLLATRQGGKGQLARRVRILGMARRVPAAEVFGPVSSALTLRRQLAFDYDGRGSGSRTARTVSPQRLVHYRDNWYLDAWDHGAEGLRTFAVERMHDARALATKAQEVPDATLDAELAGGYGIFAGAPSATAVLRFSAHRARWVADETWHPAQTARWLADGRYELSMPYSDPRELVMDVLRFGPDCEVAAPPDLRALVRNRLREALSIYGPAAGGETSEDQP
ncbi:MAG: helix-turn-helix transcriptional regulator [Gammaproteobacteria bacterium]